MAEKRAHIIYTGTVQGVGFRWTTQSVADTLNLTGWVQNRPDGTVEAVCEGEEKDIELFMSRIKKSMGPYIHSQNVTWEKASGEFDTFGLKFYYK